MNLNETDVAGRLSITVPADSLDGALQMCRPLLAAFNAVAMEIEPEAASNSLRGFRAHLLVVSPHTERADEEEALRLAVVSILVYFGAERKQIRVGRSNGSLVANVLPRRPVGQDPAGVRVCGLSVTRGADPFDTGEVELAEPVVDPELPLTEQEAEELASALQAMATVQAEIVASGSDVVLTIEDYESVRRASEVLHQRGWRRAFTLHEMFEAWTSLVVEVENGYDETFLHEFTNDMACRTWLTEARPMLTERIRAVLDPELVEVDDRFRAATIERDSGGDTGLWWLSRWPRVVRE